MGYRVRFRYRTETGQVEMFLVEDLSTGLPTSDHDTRHDAATRDVARVISASPLISEVIGDDVEPAMRLQGQGDTQEPPSSPDRRIRE
jgi:hypothetical protein